MAEKISALTTQKKKEFIRNRLRLLQTRLNAGMFKTGLHENCNCNTRDILQDCLHFILERPDSENLRSEIKSYYHSAKPWTYQDLISNEHVLNNVASYVINNNISI